MNKRQFLLGLSASVGAALTPAMVETVVQASPAINYEAWLNKWIADWSVVFAQVMADQLIYGRGAMRTTETYPFIERVDPSTLEERFDPHAFQGLALRYETP